VEEIGDGDCDGKWMGGNACTRRGAEQSKNEWGRKLRSRCSGSTFIGWRGRGATTGEQWSSIAMGAAGLDCNKGEHLIGEETEGELWKEAAASALVLLDGELEGGVARETGKRPAGAAG
jgi:hypothetical protein